MIAKLEWQEQLRSHDDLRQGLVVCSGALAKHLDKDDPQVLATVDLLVMALSTPSEIVQRSVAGVLAPLMKTMDGEHAKELVCCTISIPYPYLNPNPNPLDSYPKH